MISKALLRACLPCLLLVLLLPFGGPRQAYAASDVSLSAAMTAYSYAPGDKANLAVDLQIPETREAALSLQLLLYPALTTRDQLASFREGKRRYPILTVNLETIGTKTEWQNKEYPINLDEYGLDSGVYPFEVTVNQENEVLASSYNFLVIMRATAGKPLNVSPLWSMDFPPSANAAGSQVDSSLAAACSSSGTENGFFYQLLSILKQAPEIQSNIMIPEATYEDLETLAAQSQASGAEGPEKGAAEILKMLNDMSASGQIDIMGTTYASADLDSLLQMGLDSDAYAQLHSGLEAAQRFAQSRQDSSRKTGFVTPLFDLTDNTVKRLSEGGAGFTVVNEETLQASPIGRSLLEGYTLCQPVNFEGLDGSVIKAFPRDEAIYSYLEGTTETDASRLTQGIVAELAMLQREHPFVERACVLTFPASFVPSGQFLEQFYNTIKGSPWLRIASLSVLDGEQAALQGDRSSVPAPAYEGTQSGYSVRLGEIRSEALAYSNAIQLEKHPLKAQLSRAIMVAENYRFTTERDSEAGQAYLDSMENLIKDELSKVKIEQKRSYTLSSTQGNLTVAVSSSLDYPVVANLKMENPSLTIDNQNGITIRPRENSFSFSVNTHRKGSFMVDIILETGGLMIDQTSTTVNTSIINTMAVILLACLAGLVAAVVLGRRLSHRYYKGKHAKGGNA